MYVSLKTVADVPCMDVEQYAPSHWGYGRGWR